MANLVVACMVFQGKSKLPARIEQGRRTSAALTVSKESASCGCDLGELSQFRFDHAREVPILDASTMLQLNLHKDMAELVTPNGDSEIAFNGCPTSFSAAP